MAAIIGRINCFTRAPRGKGSVRKTDKFKKCKLCVSKGRRGFGYAVSADQVCKDSRKAAQGMQPLFGTQ